MAKPRIIKSAEGTQGRKAEAYVFEDLEAEARAIILDARRRAEEVIREALTILRAAKRITVAIENNRAEVARRERELDKLTRQAQDKGYKEGLEKGREAGYPEGVEAGREAAVDIVRREVSEQVVEEIRMQMGEKTAHLAETISKIVENLEKEALRLETTARDEMIKLAVAIAERIIKTEIAVDPDVIKANVQNAIDLSIQKSDIEVVVNPADRELVESFAPRITEIFSRIKHVTVVEDSSVTTGGCLVRSGGGVVDLQIETQLDEIKKRLLTGGSEGESDIRF